MGRRSVVVLALGVLALAGCRPDTVALGFRPAVGARYSFRYEIEATITRTIEGEPPEVTEITTVVTADEAVIEVTDAGIRLRVQLQRDGGVAHEATATVDRAGALLSIEDAGGFGSDPLTASALDAALAAAAAPPPTRPVALGERWSIDGEATTGTAVLDRLGVVDDHDVAVVTAAIEQPVDERLAVSDSAVDLVGTLATDTTTTYDLGDGAIREATATSDGDVRATIAPPAGSLAAPVVATITYEIVVQTTREG